MSADDWTLAKGWMILGMHLVVRGLLIAAIETGVMLGIALALRRVPMVAPGWVGTFILLIVVGWPLGAMVSWRLSDTCGLAPRTILLPVVVLLLGAGMAGFNVFGLFEQTGVYFYLVAFSQTGWSIIAAGKELLTE